MTGTRAHWINLPLAAAGVALWLGTAVTPARPQTTQPPVTPQPPLPDAPAFALVIGNSGYGALPRLPGCELSAGLAASALSRAGYRVTQLADPSNARLGTAISALGDEAAAAPGTRAVIYYCGHVAALGDRLFLLPVGARLDRDADALTGGIVARLAVASVAAPDGAAGLALLDVGARPGLEGTVPFAALARPGDGDHAGVAVAQLTTQGEAAAGPLASALADSLRGDASIGGMLSALSEPANAARLHVTMASLPRAPSWLVAPAAPPVQATPASIPAPAAAAGLAAAGPAAAGAALAAPGAADRRQLQLALQRLGYLRARVSGTFGPDTVAAIRRYQAELGDEATGRLTQAQAGRLLR